ncbi:MAG: LamB/YcsF family protein [Chitinophagaceae bacterium]|nr:LamB/YcsF family protein [Chitinophagaceae bacterium]
MLTIDINCDMGEGVGNESMLFPYISSANIACGYHAGDENTMRDTVRMAKHYRVSIGAHPSFKDRENFGRNAERLSAREIHTLVTEQLKLFGEIVREEDALMTHVKPHGALYNLSAKDPEVAAAIAGAVKDFNENLLLYGLSGSCSIREGKALQLTTVSEVFADRTYQADGSLTPRSSPGACIETIEEASNQVIQMVRYKNVISTGGKMVPVAAESVCIHGDGAHAVEFAKHIFEALQRNNIVIQARSNR